MGKELRDRHGNEWQPPTHGKWPKLSKVKPGQLSATRRQGICFVFYRDHSKQVVPVAKRRGVIGPTLVALQMELRGVRTGSLMVTWACGEKNQLDALAADTSSADKVTALLRALDSQYH